MAYCDPEVEVVDSQSVHQFKGHLEGNCPANHNSMLTPPTLHGNSQSTTTLILL